MQTCLNMHHACSPRAPRLRAALQEAIMAQLNPFLARAIVGILYLKYFLVTVGYTVVAATAMSYMARWICEATGVPKGQCRDELWLHVLIFSGLQVGAPPPNTHTTTTTTIPPAHHHLAPPILRKPPPPTPNLSFGPHPFPTARPALPQVFLSQCPDLESVAGASAIGALMSICYTVLALVLCFVHIGARAGSPFGREAAPINKGERLADPARRPRRAPQLRRGDAACAVLAASARRPAAKHPLAASSAMHAPLALPSPKALHAPLSPHLTLPCCPAVFGVFNALGSMLFSNASAVLTVDVSSSPPG